MTRAKTTPTTPTTPTTEWCVPYCRVSSEKQAAEERGSLDQQERDALETARKAGLRVLYVVKDAESAWVLDKRSKFQAVLRDAKAGKFTVLIADRMNRFTRSEDLGEYITVMAALREAGVRLLFSSREYGASPVGQFLQFADAYVSSQEQANRQKQAMVGKRARVHTHHRPIPGSWPKYGYVWADAKKTQMLFDPGDSQRIMRRIWDYFLHGAKPTQRGIAITLNREGVPTPRDYRGIKRAKNAVAGGPRWTATTIHAILHDATYWGGDADGQVWAFHYSAQETPVAIPAFAPAYISRDEAARVHARLASNKRYAKKHRTHAVPTLLHDGLVKCGVCGWGLQIHANTRTRMDGSTLLMYRCNHSNQMGVRACPGVTLSAEVLDRAVVDLLDHELNRGTFLERLFAAWDADAEAVQGDVRSAARTLAETEQQIANQAARLASYLPGDAVAAPIEAHMRLLQETLLGLRARLATAQAALARAQANPKLRDELGDWFSAWLGGFTELSRERQRDFLFSIHATVRLWRAGTHTPRAVLSIALPSAVSLLPPAPAAAEDWTLPVDLAEGQALTMAAREMAEQQVTFVGAPHAPTVWGTGTAAEALETINGAIVSSASRCPRKATAAGR